MNERIRAQELRVIDEDGNQVGVLSRAEALRSAREAGLDLVEISPNAKPPVAKIIDWGKYNYQKSKQIKRSQTKSRANELKQIRMGLQISDHDLEVKNNKAWKFLEAGQKVKYTLRFKGRELAHKEVGFALADKIIESYGDNVIVDQKPQFAGRQLSFTVRRSNAQTKDTQRD